MGIDVQFLCFHFALFHNSVVLCLRSVEPIRNCTCIKTMKKMIVTVHKVFCSLLLKKQYYKCNKWLSVLLSLLIIYMSHVYVDKCCLKVILRSRLDCRPEVALIFCTPRLQTEAECYTLYSFEPIIFYYYFPLIVSKAQITEISLLEREICNSHFAR